MRVFKYGLVLEKIKHHQIEMLRGWRNAPEIRRNMEFKNHISKEMQEDWFKKIDNENHFFFIIHFQDVPIGMIHISDIDWRKKSAQSGLFISKKEYMKTNAPVSASLAMLDVFFDFLGIETVFAKTHHQNLDAIRYNQALGFEKSKSAEGNVFDIYVLTKNRYYAHADKLRKITGKLYGTKLKVEIDKPENFKTLIPLLKAHSKKTLTADLVLKSR